MRRREFIAGIGAAASAAVCRFNPVYAQGVSAVTRRTVRANGINLHLAEMGEGPLVVMCHGFPECWYSWRHQLAALSAAGFHAVAPDMRVVTVGPVDRRRSISTRCCISSAIWSVSSTLSAPSKRL
jgi:hypothetical protein